MRKLLILICLSLPAIQCFSQGTPWIEKNDEELAIQFYQQGEYEKARSLFEELVDEDGKDHLSDYYLNCLIKLEEFRDARKFLKSRIRKEITPFKYRVDLGYVYSLEGDEKNAKKEYESLIDDVPADLIRVKTIASAFERRQLDEYAIEAYEKGRKRLNNDNLFANNLAELYGAKGEMEAMMDEYIRHLQANPYAEEEVKSALSTYTSDASNAEAIRTYLLKKSQSNPDKIIYADLLGWYFLSQGDYYSAFVQERALDQRLDEMGKRVFDMARICQQNRAYKVAEQCYEYIKELGNRSPYYYQAKLGAINMKYTRVTETSNYTEQDIIELEKDYEAFVQDSYIPFNEKYKGYLRLAEVRAELLGKVTEAIKLLESLKEDRRISPEVRAEIKLSLGDYYLLKGDIWDAKLIYWQVEKDFRDHPLGHRAKFMKAKITFYTGEFELARSLLDILKGSTSELISNDALHLSMLIQDNLGLDTTVLPLQLYARADQFIFMNRLLDAEKTLDTLNQYWPGHDLSDEVLMLRGGIAEKKREYQKAADYYERIVEAYSQDILVDDALYKAANLYQYYLKDDEKALELLEKLIVEHQDSVFSVEARKRFRELRGEKPANPSP